MKSVLIVLAALAVSACASTGANWTQAGVTQAQLSTDAGRCTHLARTSPATPAGPSWFTAAYQHTDARSSVAALNQAERAAHIQQYVFDRCMTDRGYSRSA